MEEIKCAVYTRKSTDEGLEKEFNTLEAQREAGENYVKSQKHQGWVLIKEHYDDGGFSGGNMNRTSLKRLLQDVEAGMKTFARASIDRMLKNRFIWARLNIKVCFMTDNTKPLSARRFLRRHKMWWLKSRRNNVHACMIRMKSELYAVS